MKKSEIKQRLIEWGLNPVLAEMPCVIEPIFEKYKYQNIEEVRREMQIQIENNGNGCQFFKRQILLEDDGTAKIQDDGLIYANKFGIEIKYYTGSYLDIHSSITRNKGVVEDDWTNEGSLVSAKGLRLDTGSWSIHDAGGVKIRGKYWMPLEFDEEIVLQEFDAKASEMIQDYPQTEEWYKEAREKLVEAIAIEKDPLKRARLKVEALRNGTKELEEDNEVLIRRCMLEASNLRQNLELLEAIKNSPVGNVFFKKIIEEYEKLRKEEKIDEKQTTRFRVKSKKQGKSTDKSEKDKNEIPRNLSESEQQELDELTAEIQSLEPKYLFLKGTNIELKGRYNSIRTKEYFTSKVVDKIRQSSGLKKLFVIGAVRKHKKEYSDAEIYYR